MIYRAFCEEICKVEVNKLDINILGFVFDESYNQWNIIGCINTDLTKEGIIMHRSRGALGKWELSNMDSVDNEIAEIMLYCASHKMWDMTYVILYYTLSFNGVSIEKILKYIKKYDTIKKSNNNIENIK